MKAFFWIPLTGIQSVSFFLIIFEPPYINDWIRWIIGAILLLFWIFFYFRNNIPYEYREKYMIIWMMISLALITFAFISSKPLYAPVKPVYSHPE
jgi:hypothetical protein